MLRRFQAWMRAQRQLYRDLALELEGHRHPDRHGLITVQPIPAAASAQPRQSAAFTSHDHGEMRHPDDKADASWGGVG